ncbi:MAG: hypothetical protein R6U99_07870 [Nioella sp.]
MLRRAVLALGLLLGLAACGAEPVWAPDEAVARARFEPGGPPTVTLYTMISNRSGAGGHSALMIDADQRLLFDPAGTWHHPAAPERNDVIFGMSPQLLSFYIDYHARETYHVVAQEVEVSPEVAAQLSRAVQDYGPVPSAQCSLSVSSILGQVPGWDHVRRSYFPVRTMNAFAEIPGVRSEQIFDDDADNNTELLTRQARAELRAQQVEAALGDS